MILMKNIVKIKFNSDDELYLNKTIDLFFMKITNIIHTLFKVNVYINYE